jgi:hypothetical protein
MITKDETKKKIIRTEIQIEIIGIEIKGEMIIRIIKKETTTREGEILKKREIIETKTEIEKEKKIIQIGIKIIVIIISIIKRKVDIEAELQAGIERIIIGTGVQDQDQIGNLILKI